MIVTVPALVVPPAAMVSVVPVSVKSVPAPGDAVTVTVVAALDGCDNVAVTVETFDVPLSPMLEADNASVAQAPHRRR